jgi:hypothetical protein
MQEAHVVLEGCRPQRLHLVEHVEEVTLLERDGGFALLHPIDFDVQEDFEF